MSNVTYKVFDLKKSLISEYHKSQNLHCIESQVLYRKEENN